MPEISRRRFLKTAAAAIIGSTVGTSLPGLINNAEARQENNKFKASDITYEDYSHNRDSIGPGSLEKKDINNLVKIANEILKQYPFLFERLTLTNRGMATAGLDWKTNERIVEIDKNYCFDEEILRNVFWHECGHLIEAITFFKDRVVKEGKPKQKIMRMNEIYKEMFHLSMQGSPILTWFADTNFLPQLREQNRVPYRTEAPNEAEMFAMAFSAYHNYRDKVLAIIKSGTPKERALVEEYLSYYPSTEEIAEIIKSRDY